MTRSVAPRTDGDRWLSPSAGASVVVAVSRRVRVPGGPQSLAAHGDYPRCARRAPDGAVSRKRDTWRLRHPSALGAPEAAKPPRCVQGVNALITCSSEICHSLRSRATRPAFASLLTGITTRLRRRRCGFLGRSRCLPAQLAARDTRRNCRECFASTAHEQMESDRT